VTNTKYSCLVGYLFLAKRDPDQKAKPGLLVGWLERNKLSFQLGGMTERLAAGEDGAAVT
jgi:hypothetical protein